MKMVTEICSCDWLFIDVPGSNMPMSPADLHGMWYPTVRRTLVCMSKLYRCIDVSMSHASGPDSSFIFVFCFCLVQSVSKLVILSLHCSAFHKKNITMSVSTKGQSSFELIRECQAYFIMRKKTADIHRFSKRWFCFEGLRDVVEKSRILVCVCVALLLFNFKNSTLVKAINRAVRK